MNQVPQLSTASASKHLTPPPLKKRLNKLKKFTSHFQSPSFSSLFLPFSSLSLFPHSVLSLLSFLFISLLLSCFSKMVSEFCWFFVLSDFLNFKTQGMLILCSSKCPRFVNSLFCLIFSNLKFKKECFGKEMRSLNCETLLCLSEIVFLFSFFSFFCLLSFFISFVLFLHFFSLLVLPKWLSEFCLIFSFLFSVLFIFWFSQTFFGSPLETELFMSWK